MSLNKKVALLVAVLLATVGVGFIFYYRQPLALFERGGIVDFNESRDTQPILDLFNTDRYWLLSNPNSSPERMLKYRTPRPYDPFYAGKLYIKVLREQGKFVGFVSYYKETFKDWRLLFVAVKPDMRGKHAAEKLMKYALEDMKKLGATRVILTTRTENYRAQTLYKRIGFTVFAWDVPPGYVDFEKKLK